MMTYDEALALLERTVKDRGEDYVYRADKYGQCLYADKTGAPSCGVGYAVDLYDHEAFTRLAVWEDENHTDDPARIFAEVDIQVERKALLLMSVFQERQDAEEPYGEALYEAKQRVAKCEARGDFE